MDPEYQKNIKDIIDVLLHNKAFSHIAVSKGGQWTEVFEPSNRFQSINIYLHDERTESTIAFNIKTSCINQIQIQFKEFIQSYKQVITNVLVVDIKRASEAFEAGKIIDKATFESLAIHSFMYMMITKAFEHSQLPSRGGSFFILNYQGYTFIRPLATNDIRTSQSIGEDNGLFHPSDVAYVCQMAKQSDAKRGNIS